MMTPEKLAELAAPFPPEAVGIRPQVWCPDCWARDVECAEHVVKPCAECGTTVTEAHDDVEYVGHAWVRERLNKVDPMWNWEPLAYDADGLPMFDRFGGLWQKITVCGKTMLGYGDAPNQRGSRAVKETIGDGLRNGGQSFGIALSMWQQRRPPRAVQPAGPKLTDEQRAARLRDQIKRFQKGKGKTFATVVNGFDQWAAKAAADAGQTEDVAVFRTAGPDLLTAYKKRLGIK
ncbi:hypothetical protein [Amycolatopsis sp. NPDC051128]|uniref:hypothetical protein n=1 Tax=Amycolatopsis sp. NPDC051128 TaxID=3155412 RepID=UPI003436B5C9